MTSKRQIIQKCEILTSAVNLVLLFGDQQMETLADIIQTALMLRINKRKVG